MKLLEGLSLEEKQRLYYNGSHCPYCGEETVFVDSIEVYQESYGMIHLCRPCKAWVNVHINSDQAYGFVARKELRDLRHQAHLIFDPLWQKKVSQGTKRKVAQAKAREWLAKQLDIEIIECHMGMFTNEMCLRTIELCKPFYLTVDQVAHQKSMLKYRIDVVHFNATEFEYEVKEFSMNGQVQMELRRKDGKVYYYDPKRQIGRFSNKKKSSPVEDIEEFIFKNFK